ncbi:unnamed protein product [Meganyctiphanes norvegica]|uniref:2-oxo-4-hydroxy-4-carboxy-5-ureidoimidazoline decarboxylase n=1 Tax=Meganyctiphanes norvegica TaxID=48144 RepID=A0AAV2SLD3_MEGNR
MISGGPLMSVEQVNGLDYEDFIRVFGNVIENYPLAATFLWYYRPYRDVNQMHDYISTLARRHLPIEDKKGILRLLPDLAGRLAEAGNLSAESTYEQRTAGLTLLTPNEKQRIRSLNKRYWDRFGFPFVVCAR